MLKVFVANHIPIICNGLREIINSEEDLAFVGEAETGHMAQRCCLQLQPNVAILDSSLPGPSLSSLINNLLASCPKTSLLILTDSADSVDIQFLIERGISGCILQNESDILVSQAIRTVGHGAVWFSKCFIAGFLQHSTQKDRNSNQVSDLTPRELEVIRFVAEGLSNRQIARTLSVKERTIEFHMTNILQKLNMDNRVAAAMWTRDHIL